MCQRCRKTVPTSPVTRHTSPVTRKMRIPFDSLTLAAVVHELRPLVKAKVQRVNQPDEHSIALVLYTGGAEAYVLVSWHPEFARAHLTSRRLPSMAPLPPFCTALRAKLDQARLRDVLQVGFDRILVLTFEQPDAEYRLIGEFMGKHSNLVLVDSDDRILAVGKPIGVSKSRRPLLVGRRYEPPPVPHKPSLLNAEDGDDLSQFEGASPFLVRLIGALPDGLRLVRQVLHQFQTTHAAGSENRKSELGNRKSELGNRNSEIANRKSEIANRKSEIENRKSVLSPGNGAYPISVAALGLPEFPRPSISIALEQHFSAAVEAYEVHQVKSSLTAQLNRVLLAREAAISDLEQVRDAAKRADQLQLMGELILAYGPTLEPGAKRLSAEDYEGKPVEIALDPEKTFLENANKFFEKAKKAKGRAGFVQDQLARFANERAQVDSLLGKVEAETRLEPLLDLREQAREHHWLHGTAAPAARKKDRPFEGHRIRELIGPGGLAVLYGENAESNDYLTMRVAKPDDLWLHVRGSVSAHVVIRTMRHPEKVGKEALLFAAKVAVQNSPSKHSSYVPVDYTLKKHVRKPKGAPAGTALYTHEKTLHVDAKV